jgi:hypothetical protein
MQRQQATQNARNGNYQQPLRPTSPTPQNTPTAVAPSTPSAPAVGGLANRQFGIGSMVGAAAVGGLIGYMLHSDDKGNSYYTKPDQPGVAFDANGNKMESVPQGQFQPVGTVGQNGAVAGVTEGAALKGESARQINQATGLNSQPAAPASSGASMGWILLLMGLLGGGVYWFLRQQKKDAAGTTASVFNKPAQDQPMMSAMASPMNQSNTSNSMAGSGVSGVYRSDDPETQLRGSAERLFYEFQTNNKPSQINMIQARSEAAFFAAIKDTVLNASETRQISVQRMTCDVVDVTYENGQLVGSVHYRCLFEETDQGHVTQTRINEVWHFVHQQGQWLLAGIEPLEDEVNIALN